MNIQAIITKFMRHNTSAFGWAKRCNCADEQVTIPTFNIIEEITIFDLVESLVVIFLLKLFTGKCWQGYIIPTIVEFGCLSNGI